jgi:hypothetical protein
MGGKAFAALLPNALFPRLPSAQYAAQKQLLLPRVQRFFREVTVPVEAPEKVDHGDLDILAFEPLEPDERGDYDFEAVKQALGAETVIRATGNRTSNFALPLPDGYGVTASDGDSGLKYFQVDIQVCEDRREFERIKFFHSYGDMGMLLGLVGKGVGLPTGAKGLHVRRLLYLVAISFSRSYRPVCCEKTETNPYPPALTSATTFVPFFPSSVSLMLDGKRDFERRVISPSGSGPRDGSTRG